MDRTAQTERYTVEVRLPGRGPPVPIIIPFPPSSTVSAFADEVSRRARRYGINAAVSALHLGENGPLLDLDDLLHQVVIHPQDEKVFAVFENGSSQQSNDGESSATAPQQLPFPESPQDMNPFRSPVRKAAPLYLQNGNDFKVRVITPFTARSKGGVNNIPLLFNGRAIKGSMTLRELRRHITDFLKWPLGTESQKPTIQECNCAFARRISERGIWEKIECQSRGPTSTAFHRCDFTFQGVLVDMSRECAICAESLGSHDRSEGSGPSGCSSKLFIRTDGSCNHLLHSHCLDLAKTWTCPRSCLSVSPPAPQGTNEVGGSSSSRFIIVHGKGEVEWIEADASDKDSLVVAIRGRLGDDVEAEKAITLIGGTRAPSSNLHVNLPVVSLCSHGSKAQSHTMDSDSDSDSVPYLEDDLCGEARPLPELRHAGGRGGLDLHTSEGPIETTDLDVTLDQASLKDCAVRGVLNFYAIQRSRSGDTIAKGEGKEAIFKAASFWDHPTISQSERGMALFLSSLRLFTDLINAKEMDRPAQDSVLHVFHHLTQFPPALRAVHVLMNGKTPRTSECAALNQAVFAVLEDMIPSGLIFDQKDRILEGSRLFFGFLLDRAEQVKRPDDSILPYLSSFETIDLRDTETLEPIVRPVLTSIGLVEEGYYKAHREGGILAWTNGEPPLKSEKLGNQTRRIALLCGGAVPEVTIFHSDSLYTLSQGESSRRPSEKDAAKILAEGFPDPTLLSSLCERTGLAVLPPSTLRSSKAPALTLDRDALAAVYTGRPPCAAPPKDITIFRPTKGGDENVDIAIIAQVIAPILQGRDIDGTAVFDLFSGGAGRSKAIDPEEVIIFCVDCSRSMQESSDFLDIKEEENDQFQSEKPKDEVKKESAIQSSDIENGTYVDATLDEMKELITKHESFEDMLAILYAAPSYKKQTFASDILEFLSILLSRHLSFHLKKLESLREWATRTYLRTESQKYEITVAKLKSQIAGLNSNKQALCDLLIFRASDSGRKDEKWTWNFGDQIPKWPQSGEVIKDMENQFQVPHDYLCPIGIAVFEDPVTASDGFTYERSSIERWFQIRKSSPSTGLPLQNTTVHHNGALAREVKKWVEGEDITNSSPPDTKRRRSLLRPRRSQKEIQFFSRLGSFNRKLPLSLSIADLYLIAFRGMKGVHSQFDLRYNGAVLTPSSDTIQSLDLAESAVVQINIHENKPPAADSKGDKKSENRERTGCLIKVYEHHDKEAFSYWTTKDTTDSVASILFRYWRFLMSTPWRNKSLLNQDIMTGLKHNGDGHLTGIHQDHWTSLSSLLTREIADGRLTTEKTYNDGSEPEVAQTTIGGGSGESSSANQPEERPLVLKAFVRTRRPKDKPSATQLSRVLSRLDVMKEIFQSFINRILAYNYPTHIGLITFETTAGIATAPTHIIENFRDSVSRMKANGDTALWDALALANEELSQHIIKFPNAKKRIICLSDGEDTKSTRAKHDVCRSLEQNNVIVDSFCLGDADNVDLRTISYLTGGYKFAPKTLEQAMSICEMEPVLNQLERLPRSRGAGREGQSLSGSFLAFSLAKASAFPDTVTRDVYPERKQHPHLSDAFVQLSTIAQSIKNPPSTSTSTSSNSRPSNFNLRFSRLLSEIKTILNNPHPHYDVYVSESNIGFWKVVMQGPPETAFAAGTFLLYLDMDASYPSSPPKARFVTRILHPNINRHGRVCHSILDRNWTLDTTNLKVLNTVYSLLLVPEFSDPINTIVTFDFHWDEVAFQEEVREHVRRWAVRADGQGREGWSREILGEEAS